MSIKDDKPHMLKRKQIEGKETDKDRWEWLLKQRCMGCWIVVLDNDVTYIRDDLDEENEWDGVRFDEHIGNAPGITELLKVFGIKSEHV
jgi:hypothetical protein